jgi:hypothetical protein
MTAKVKELHIAAAEHHVTMAKAHDVMCKADGMEDSASDFHSTCRDSHTKMAEAYLKCVKADSDELEKTMRVRAAVPAFNVDPLFAKLVAIDEDDPNMRNLYL